MTAAVLEVSVGLFVVIPLADAWQRRKGDR